MGYAHLLIPSADPLSYGATHGGVTSRGLQSEWSLAAHRQKDHTARLWSLSWDELVGLACR